MTDNTPLRAQIERPDPDYDLVETVFDEAARDQKLLDRLMADPVGVFRGAGLSIPDGTEDAFRSMFLNEADTALTTMQSADIGALMAFPRPKCAICKTAAWGVASLIVAVGAGALATLSVGSGPVIALAAFASVSTTAALAFIVSLGGAVSLGTAAVVNAICDWTNACS